MAEHEPCIGADYLPARAPDPAMFERQPVATAACFDCGRLYGEEVGFSDLVIPDWAWKHIAPVDGEGLLCPSCLCGRLFRAGIECEGRFTSGPLVSSIGHAPVEYVRQLGDDPDQR